MRLPLLSILVIAAAFPAGGQQFPPTPVIVAEVVRQPIQDEVELVGATQPRHASLVASQIEGKVISRAKEAGQDARRGELLFQLDTSLVSAALVEARADVELQGFNYAQNTQLFEKEAISEQQLRDSAYQLDRAHAKLQNLEKQLADTAIRAPFRGHLVQTFSELGEWVSRGQGVARLIAIDTVRVYVNVPEAHVPRLQVGGIAQVFIDALGALGIEGRIVATLAEGYAESHTFPVVVEIPNPAGRIRSNMAARVRFRIQHPEASLLIPKDALVNGPFGPMVFLAVEDKAVGRPLKPGAPYNGYVAVEGQLQPGDLAIVRGNERLRDGQPIRVLRKQE